MKPVKPKKPCDYREYRDRLPCLAPGEDRCFGALCWDQSRKSHQTRVRDMRECPWLDRVRAFWARKGYGK